MADLNSGLRMTSPALLPLGHGNEINKSKKKKKKIPNQARQTDHHFSTFVPRGPRRKEIQEYFRR